MADSPNPYDDLFTLPHKALRRGLFGLVECAGAHDWDSHKDAVDLRDSWSTMRALLISHADHEDRFIFPMVEVVAPGATVRASSQHPLVETMLARADEAVAHALDNPSTTTGADAYRRLNQFVATYLDHLLVEETEVVPAIVDGCTPAALDECRAAFIADDGPGDTVEMLVLMVPAIAPAERRQLIRAGLASLPASVVDGVVQALRPRIPADALADVEAALREGVSS